MTEQELSDAIIRHALDLQRLSAGEEAKALETLRQLEAELRMLLASRDLTDAGKREIEALIREADKAIEAGYSKLPIDTQTLFAHVAERTTEIMAATFPARAVSAERLASLAKEVLIDGAPTSAWWRRQAGTLQFQFAAQVKQGVVNGETMEQIVSRIVGKGGEIGVMEVAKRHARALVHSSVMSAANQARLAVFKKNARFLSGVRWLATLDSHTCRTCMALDGQAWDLEGEPLKGTTMDFQLPPAHTACRCVATAIPKKVLDEIFGVKGLDARVEPDGRASKDGVTSAMTFTEFLKRQPPEFVEEVLGTKRAEMYLAGKLTLRDLVSGSGRPLTLEEL